MNRRDLMEWLGATNVTLVAPPALREPEAAQGGRTQPQGQGREARHPG